MSPTNPRYSAGGWIAIQGLSRRGFIPRPSWGGNGTVTNGEATETRRTKKKPATAAHTAATPAKSWGRSRATDRSAASEYADSTTAQRSSDPSIPPQNAVTV